METAARMISPLIMNWVSMSRPIRTTMVLKICIIKTPAIVPMSLPFPPKKDVPPTTAAAMESRSKPVAINRST